jgi:hypothetical protein
LERGQELRSAETTIDSESREELEKLLIELPPEHWSGNGAERVWGKRVRDQQYEVRNTPWYAFGINWGDVVRCEGLSEAELPIVRQVVHVGGHRTLRIMLEASCSAQDRVSVLARLNELGATYENANETLYAVDVEPGVDVGPIVAELDERERAGVLEWESTW